MPVGYLTKYQKWVNAANDTQKEIAKLQKEVSLLGNSKNDLELKKAFARQIAAKEKWYEICKARAAKAKL